MRIAATSGRASAKAFRADCRPSCAVSVPARRRNPAVSGSKDVGIVGLFARHEVGQNFSDFGAELLAGNNGVDQTVCEHELGSLETFGEILMGGFLNDAWSRKSDHATWLSEVDVADSSEGGGDSSRGRVSENREVGQGGFLMTRERATGFGHLHEREHPLLHACTGGSRDHDDGPLFFGGSFDGSGDFFAYNGTHGTGKEFEVHYGDGDREAVDGSAPSDDGIIEIGLLPHGIDLLGILVKTEWVGREQSVIHFFERAGVGKELDAITRGEEEVLVAIGADMVVLLEV